jgi:hypothetical protein
MPLVAVLFGLCCQCSGVIALETPSPECCSSTPTASSHHPNLPKTSRKPPAPGDVPNLMGPDDLEQIAAAMKPLMAAAGVSAVDKNSVYAFFVDRWVELRFGGSVPASGPRLYMVHAQQSSAACQVVSCRVLTLRRLHPNPPGCAPTSTWCFASPPSRTLSASG